MSAAQPLRYTYQRHQPEQTILYKVVQDTSKKGLVAANSGFSLHAGVFMAGNDRDKIEKVCRYIARPAIALERLHFGANGQVLYTLKKPYDDGTTAISMTPLELMERLAALVPRPKIHLTRFSGVFAPHYKYRSLVVPKPSVSAIAKLNDTEAPPTKARMTWARLLKRVFKIDVETCHLCSGKMKIIAAIENPKLIKKILTHLGLPSTAPTTWSARGPPGANIDDFQQLPELHFS